MTTAGQIRSIAPAAATPIPAHHQVLDFARAVQRGLSDRPRWIPSRFLYDAEGSRLFEQICDTPEYYLTRAETDLLVTHAATIARLTGPRTLVELGAGSGRKTTLLIDAYNWFHGDLHYVPVDVSAEALGSSARRFGSMPGVTVEPVHGSYSAAFPLLRQVRPLLLLFLGSTVGNLDTTEAAFFWRRLSTALSPGDFVLLGVDLIKDPALLDQAYNDSAGWSAAFTRNLFARMNRELGSSVDLSAIEHQASYQADWARVEIFARLTRTQTIRVAPLDRTITLAAGERVLTEISRKFHPGELPVYLSSYGLKTLRVFASHEPAYAVFLLQRSARVPW